MCNNNNKKKGGLHSFCSRIMSKDCSHLIEEYASSVFHFFEEEPPEGFVTVGAILKLKMMVAEQEASILNLTNIVENFDRKKKELYIGDIPSLSTRGPSELHWHTYHCRFKCV